MLAKLTSKNQLTLPKAVVGQFPGARYFEVRAEKGRIVLVPAKVTRSSGATSTYTTTLWRRLIDHR